MKYLSIAIVFAVVVMAFIFRYEYPTFNTRNDRWTGEAEALCLDGVTWVPMYQGSQCP